MSRKQFTIGFIVLILLSVVLIVQNWRLSKRLTDLETHVLSTENSVEDANDGIQKVADKLNAQ